MDKYIKVTYPESLEWMDDKYDGQVIQASDEHTIYTFVPEELYNRVTAVEEPTIPDESDPIWDEYVGMPEESKPWFMKNE